MNEMSGYIEDDNRLSMAIQNRDPEYLLNLENSNSLELDVMNSRGEWFQMDIILDSELILDAIIETVGKMEAIVEEIEKGTQIVKAV